MPFCRFGAGRGCMRLLGDCDAPGKRGASGYLALPALAVLRLSGKPGRKAVLTAGMIPDRITFDFLLRHGETGISGEAKGHRTCFGLSAEDAAGRTDRCVRLWKRRGVPYPGAVCFWRKEWMPRHGRQLGKCGREAMSGAGAGAAIGYISNGARGNACKLRLCKIHKNNVKSK